MIRIKIVKHCSGFEYGKEYEVLKTTANYLKMLQVAVILGEVQETPQPPKKTRKRK